ncbi:MAG: hypothetical protein COB67_01665 [SAR324 cluster bacterium]|uniref:Serine aminopeptidase S33 domain-containing protein n=1 Tax=SAR324 cluster bacterium TaxID=2024889 RepID=A0A2A4TA61_9DELT|nr:MAG: hypothetical protein COB67_01665 [SAR324 cluster bacterium]
MSPVFFFHGLEGSPKGVKARFLKKHFPSLQVPFLPPDIEARQEILLHLIREPSILIGSSLGGLSAILFAMEKPELVQGMLLLAPLVGLHDKTLCTNEEYKKIEQTYLPSSVRCVIIAAKEDEIIPLAAIRQFAAKRSHHQLIELIEVSDNHALNNSLGTLLEQAQYLVSK